VVPGRLWVRGQSCKLTGFVKPIVGMSFLPDVADPRVTREGLPCPISHVRSPTNRVFGT
jgi:hypothetical protein